jgi:hypothetical protein
MWNLNSDTNQWNNTPTPLSKDNFNIYKQALQNTRFYSKINSGSCYSSISDLNNIYNKIQYRDFNTWYISASYSNENISNSNIIDINNYATFSKYCQEYAFTEKNYFTPTKLIQYDFNNFIYADLCLDVNSDLNLAYSSIDGTNLINNQLVLVISQTDQTQNGIYLFNNSRLTKTNKLSTYNKSINFTVSIKQGITYQGAKFILQRNSNGYYPIDGVDPIIFKKGESYCLRNQLDYHNFYDSNFYDIKYYNEEFFYSSIYNATFIIPSRIISIGDFGVIFCRQSGGENLINNKFKNNLRSIDENQDYYFVVGELGTLLKIDKITFNIECINLNTFNNFNHIIFYNKTYGVIVGDNNTILFTNDGINWVNISQEYLNGESFNKAIFLDNNNLYIVGNNGVFLELTYTNNNWVIYKRDVIQYDPIKGDYLLVYDIKDVAVINVTNWTIYKENIEIILNGDFILFATLENKIVLYDKYKQNGDYYFIYLNIAVNKLGDYGDINNIKVFKSDPSYIYFSSDYLYGLNIYNINRLNSNTNILTSLNPAEIFCNTYVNNYTLDDYGILYVCGNNFLLKSSSTNVFNTNDYYINDINDFYKLYNEYGTYNSKMLFLDYDIAAKTNFFDTSGNYILPQSITISFTNSVILSDVKELNGNTYSSWIDYDRDIKKVYNDRPINNSNCVLYNTQFTQQNYSYGVINISPNQIVNASNELFNINDISSNGGSYSCVIFKDCMLFCVGETGDTIYQNIGDVIHFKTSNIDVNLIHVKLINHNGWQYLYCNHNFSQNMINNILNQNIIIKDLNIYYDVYDLISNFNNHFIGQGYKISGNTSSLLINPLFNENTAYYNMQIDINDLKLSYSESYNTFGFTPTYNIYIYLSKLNNYIFGSSASTPKKFYTMPIYNGIPMNNNNNFTPDNIYIDTGLNTNTNKLLIGINLKFQWETLWLNTFIDIILYTSVSSYSTTQLLITNKYFDNIQNGYVLEFDKQLNYPQFSDFILIDIISRNSLQQISNDLQILNNIQKPAYQKSQASFETTNFNKNFNTKFSTDSYAKILLSDGDIKKNLTGIIFTDNNYELSTCIINLNTINQIDIIGTYKSPYTDINGNGYLWLVTTQETGLKIGDSINVKFYGGTNSSEYINPSYYGYQTVLEIDFSGNYTFIATDKLSNIDNRSFVTVDLNNGYYYYPDPGYIYINKFDPFFNYEPIDLFNVGLDLLPQIALKIDPNNIQVSGSSYSLVNLDPNNYTYRLVDDLSITELSNNSNYYWILDAELSNAVIGKDKNGIVFYKGDWIYGRWFGGTWNSGTWYNGEWNGGVWNSYKTNYNGISTNVENILDNSKSKWLSGRWYGGIWNGGIWEDGRWYDGNFNNGVWNGGVWNGGIWNGGEFSSGIWINGVWNGGKLNCNNGLSYWLNGVWNGGDFENGVWFNGLFNQPNNGTSRFGTMAFNTRPAIWISGEFNGGEFHSSLNSDISGFPIKSNVNYYSFWKTGIWNGGTWYGGIAHAINFNSGTWHGGVIEDIPILGLNISTTYNSQLKIGGDFRFNIGDNIYILNDSNISTTYSRIAGTTSGSYNVFKVQYSEQLTASQSYTIITLNANLSENIYLGTTSTIGFNDDSLPYLGIKLTSYFNDSIWKSGVWTSGIFENGYFLGGIWYDGVFKSNWGF